MVDEDGRLPFHNARFREILGYEKEELELFDTREFWHGLDQRKRIIDTLRERGGQAVNPFTGFSLMFRSPIRAATSTSPGANG